MSKASEYAQRRPTDFDDGYVFASVTPTGTVAIKLGPLAASLPPERALALARWILDTFSDEKSSSPQMQILDYLRALYR